MSTTVVRRVAAAIVIAASAAAAVAGPPAYILSRPSGPRLNSDQGLAMSPGGVAVAVTYSIASHAYELAVVRSGATEVRACPPGGALSSSGSPMGVNDRGQAVASVWFAIENETRPVVWSDDHVTVLPLPAGSQFGEAWSINPDGVIAGDCLVEGQGYVPVLWHDGVIEPLQVPAGATDAVAAYARADGGVVMMCGNFVGNEWFVGVASGGAFARWDNAPGTFSPTVWHVNEAGIASGSTNPVAPGCTVPVRWRNGEPERLAVPSGYCGGLALASNSSGFTVGAAFVIPGSGAAMARGVLWKSDGSFIDLNDITGSSAGVSVTWAYGISDAGLIIVQASDGYAYILLPRCPADWNADGGVDDFDFFEFLNDFFATPPNADFNEDGTTDDFDYFDFLNAFNAGC